MPPYHTPCETNIKKKQHNISRRNFIGTVSAATLGSQLFLHKKIKGSPLPVNEIKIRELYTPAHFGNSYEVMGDQEMRDMLAEAVYWGYNRYGDWFDMLDCSDPFADQKHKHLGHALWERKKRIFYPLNLSV